jgi:hypothetical protein
MFDFLLRVKALERLGLAKPFRYVLAILLAGCLVAGSIYTCVILNAVRERSYSPHVNAHSSH